MLSLYLARLPQQVTGPDVMALALQEEVGQNQKF